MTSVNDMVQQLDKLASDLSKQKGNPLLVLYYHEFAGDVRWEDVEAIYDELRRGGYSRENMMNNLHVLLHTFGGSSCWLPNCASDKRFCEECYFSYSRIFV